MPVHRVPSRKKDEFEGNDLFGDSPEMGKGNVCRLAKGHPADPCGAQGDEPRKGLLLYVISSRSRPLESGVGSLLFGKSQASQFAFTNNGEGRRSAS